MFDVAGVADFGNYGLIIYGEHFTGFSIRERLVDSMGNVTQFGLVFNDHT